MSNIAVIGAGTSGYLSVLYFCTRYPEYNITWIYPEDNVTIGVGESTVPQVAEFLEDLGITPKEIIKIRKQFRTSVVVRNIYSEVLNIIQPIVIKKIKTNKNKSNKKYLNDALLTSIGGISAAMKNTG